MNLCNNDLCASSLINTAGPPCKVALMVGFHRLNSPHKSSWRNVTSQWAITTHLHLQPKLLGEDCISLGHDFILANYLSSLNGCESVVTFKPAPCKKLIMSTWIWKVQALEMSHPYVHESWAKFQTTSERLRFSRTWFHLGNQIWRQALT